MIKTFPYPYKLEAYTKINDFIIEYNKTPKRVNAIQTKQMSILALEIDYKQFRDRSCPVCIKNCIDILKAYLEVYKDQYTIDTTPTPEPEITKKKTKKKTNAKATN